MIRPAWVLLFGTTLLFSIAALAQDRPDESTMFGGSAAESLNAVDGGTPPSDRPDESSLFGNPTPGEPPVPDPGASPNPEADSSSDRDVSQLSGPALRNQFETEQAKADPLKIGGLLYVRAQA